VPRAARAGSIAVVVSRREKRRRRASVISDAVPAIGAMPVASRVFFSYSHEDEAFRDQLEKHLALLKHRGLIEPWHDRRILPGQVFAAAIDAALDAADIVLLLVSASFLASDYCYSIELARALERHRDGSTVVIPVIVRPCDWRAAPFGTLLATPKDGRALTQWPDIDEGYADVAAAVRNVAEAREQRAGAAAPRALPSAAAAVTDTEALPRSSNLRLRRTFSKLERDRFMRDTFDYMARFFRGSIEELQRRHADIEGHFDFVDAHTFTAALYRVGQRVSECAISLGARRDSVVFSHSAASRGSNYNESVSVDADDQALFLRALGLARAFGGDSEKLSQHGAAELYWTLFIARLQ
jgi:hypothetical protein